MKARSPCLECGTPCNGARCQTHANARHRTMYGEQHQTERTAWQRQVNTGLVMCARQGCNKYIRPGEAWDLGHQPDGPRRPEHAYCNRAGH